MSTERRLTVDVYRNLHNRQWSMRDVSTNKVIAHTPALLLEDVTFRTQPAGRQRVRDTGRKNVHAFARGHVRLDPGYASSAVDWLTAHGKRITYNPYKHESFVTLRDHEPVTSATLVLFSTAGHVWAQNPNGGS